MNVVFPYVTKCISNYSCKITTLQLGKLKLVCSVQFYKKVFDFLHILSCSHVDKAHGTDEPLLQNAIAPPRSPSTNHTVVAATQNPPPPFILDICQSSIMHK